MWNYKLVNFPIGEESLVEDDDTHKEVELEFEPIRKDELWMLFEAIKTSNSPSSPQIG